ncbi:S9 family peptidase [Litoribacter alkaliphilus]|uniref:S9 family peptidase n=1 Tax=Litoribacter ruber TaxID=702568 RepID=A0AAP2G596_9BACT|nr:S9 family peptidase [Litoribacter alkaliphilus]MBS9525305.1 S9 family peptidase [Litoribacter alkaliphilus]
MIKKNSLIFLLFLQLSLLSALAQEKKPVQISDLTKIVSTSDHKLTPDGKHLIFVKNFIEQEKEKYQYKSQVFIAPIDNPDRARPLTSSDNSTRSAELSPDGKTLAFVRSKDGKAQIYLLSLEGGEAQVLTSAKHGASSPKWSPDGKKILFSSTLPIWELEGEPTWEYERPGREFGDEPHYGAIKDGKAKEDVKPNVDGSLEEMRAYLAKNAADKDPKVITRLNFLGEKDLSPDMQFSHLSVIDINTKESRQLTNGFQNYFSADWAPDGNFLLASSVKYEDHPDETMHTDVYRIPLDGGSPTQVLHIEDHRVGNPSFSPDGEWVLVSGQDITEPSYNLGMLGIMKPDGSQFRWITEDLDRSVYSGKWSKDGQHIYYTAPNIGGVTLFRTSIEGGSTTPLIEGPVGVQSFDIDSDRLVYALTQIENPSEIYLADLDAGNAQKFSSFNDSWLAERKISKPTAHQISQDGFEIDYWVMEPVDRREGEKYPTVLQMHGGPSAMWGPGEFSMWHEYQTMTARGYGVVYANPRGSGGYGRAFQKGNFQDWGDGPASDVLGSLDDAQSRYDWIDGDQLFLTGGSYAGYLTAWIVGHDHRFKAAFAQRGVYELTFFLGEGNAWRLVPNHFGYPWEEGVKEILDYNSPQTYVDQIQTPLLIKHGDVDYRTGVRQSELLYKSLKILGKPVEYVRYPGEGHELSRSGDINRRIDRIARIIEFFERYRD